MTDYFRDSSLTLFAQNDKIFGRFYEFRARFCDLCLSNNRSNGDFASAKLNQKHTKKRPVRKYRAMDSWVVPKNSSEDRTASSIE
ncbi:hypothetical protein ACWIUD_09255 [Helicobacter sp. 23-1044]